MLLFIIVILEIVAGILGFVFRNELVEASESRAADAIMDFLPENNSNHRNDINAIVDFLQETVCVCVHVIIVISGVHVHFLTSSGVHVHFLTSFECDNN